MSERDKVVCGSHGETVATYMCRHVAAGVACGFHQSTDDPADRWPDAWCDGCAALLRSTGGEWTDATTRQAGNEVCCTHCYQAARDRNRDVPALARGMRPKLTAAEQGKLIHHAIHAGQALQAAAEARTHFGAYARWDLDTDAATMTFTDPARPTLVAGVRLVGSFSTRSSTFQWSWQTIETDEPRIRAIAQLRAFGEVRGIDKLVEPTWDADEIDGWEMTALAAMLLGRPDAMYRAPVDHLRWFMLLDHLREPPASKARSAVERGQQGRE